MSKKNSWMQKKRVILLLVLILLLAILTIAAKIGMKSGGRPHKVTESSENIIEEEQAKTNSNSETTGYGYEMDVFSKKNNSNEKKSVYEKGYNLPFDKTEEKTAKQELHEMMQETWPIYDKSEKGDTSNVVLSKETVGKILDKLESLSVSAFFSGREDNMRNAGVFDTFLKNAQNGKTGSAVVYEVHEDGGIGQNKYTFDGENMYVLYVGSVWNEGKDVISIDTTYTRIKEWDYTKDGWFTGEYCVPEPPEVSETVDGRFRIFLEKIY